MAQSPISITVFIDFMCPYSARASMWLDQVQQKMSNRDFVIHWKYFSLEQINLPAGSDWKIWEQTEDYTYPNGGWSDQYRGLLAFWAAEAARQQGSECYDRFRARLFSAIHDAPVNRPRFRMDDRRKLEGVAIEANLNLNRFLSDFYDRKLLQVLRDNHIEAVEKYQAFGVPTICFDDTNAIYVKLEETPPLEDALPFFLTLRQSFTGRRWLSEIKRPTA